MADSPLLPVEDALERILSTATTLGTEHVPISDARGRTLAEDLSSKRTQPPFASSAMDGYALRAADSTRPGAVLKRIGASAAGHSFSGTVGPGETVRIFTGAALPDGADTILIQENATVNNDLVTANEAVPPGRHIRPAGLDFRNGDVLLRAGVRFGAREIALAAAMNHASVPVVVRPRVAILATGDELVLPGETPSSDQIVASNNFAVAAAIAASGGEPLLLGIARDTFASLENAIAQARAARADILVTIGGASVGEHDLVQSALTREGMKLDFWRIAMRPGKPLLFGSLGPMRIIGLPGNPVASIVCAMNFLRPLVRALQGDPQVRQDMSQAAILATDLPANDQRQDYLRARVTGQADGVPIVTPHTRQDSSMLSTLAASDALIVRPPHAPAARAGEPCRIIFLALLDR